MRHALLLLLVAWSYRATAQCQGYQVDANQGGAYVQAFLMGGTLAGAPAACFPATLTTVLSSNVPNIGPSGYLLIPLGGSDQYITSGTVNWSYEGWDVWAQLQWSTECYLSGNWSSGQCATHTFYVDQLEPEAFTWSLQSGCTAGPQRLVLTDQAVDPGNLVALNRAAGANYQLKLNSAVVAWGPLTSRYVASPPSFTFEGLVPGAYDLLISAESSNEHFAYWDVNTAWPRFVIPVVGDCGINLPVRMVLQGALPFSGSSPLMRDDLCAAGLVPAVEPYAALGYTYVGSSPGASITPTLLAITGGNAIVDWVVVELRSATNPAVVIESRAGLLQRDGEVMDTNGEAWMNFSAPPGNYHVAVRHRNHLAVRTATAVACGPSVFGVDFTRPGVPYGTAPVAYNFDMGNLLWAGDANSNGTLNYTGSGNDRDLILIAVGSTTPNNVVGNTYSTRDVNMNGQVKYTGTSNDRDVILSNVGSSTPNAVRVQQVP